MNVVVGQVVAIIGDLYMVPLYGDVNDYNRHMTVFVAQAVFGLDVYSSYFFSPILLT